MNKVLVTGLGTAKDLDMCEACGLNFSWLIDNPSTILWADQICIPQNAYEIAKAQSERKDERVISMFLNMVENQGIIKPIDLSRMYPKSLGNEIKKKMLEDSQTLLETFPEAVKRGEPNVPAELLLKMNIIVVFGCRPYI